VDHSTFQLWVVVALFVVLESRRMNNIMCKTDKIKKEATVENHTVNNEKLVLREICITGLNESIRIVSSDPSDTSKNLMDMVFKIYKDIRTGETKKNVDEFQ